MRFTTASDSVYEVDFDAKRIRRIAGRSNPKHKLTDEWRSFYTISAVETGLAVMVFWNDDESIFNHLLTSPVVDVIDILH